MSNIAAAIITIGDELLIGQTIDTNSAWIAQHLSELGIDVLRKRLLDPLAFYGAGQPEQRKIFGAATGNFANGSDDEERGILDDAFAHEGSGAAFGEVAFEGAEVAADAELVNESGHETAEQGGVIGFFIGLQQFLLPGDLDDLLMRLLDLPRGLRVDAVAAAGWWSMSGCWNTSKQYLQNATGLSWSVI